MMIIEQKSALPRRMGLKYSSENVQMDAKKPDYGHLNPGLKTSMEDPKFIVYSDDLVVIIKDKYPKARFHFLTLPKRNIRSLGDVSINHLSLLKHMHERAEIFCTKIKSKHKFQFGYHAIPSMSHLHLHMISQDLSGPWMETKSQWNSFTTEFFMSSRKIIEQLESSGHIHFMDTEQCVNLLFQPIRCHICKNKLPSVAILKEHLKLCLKNSLQEAGK